MNTNPSADARWHSLDALRALALLLGFLVHGSMAFLPDAEHFWITHDKDPSQWLGLFFFVPHMFRMILFFMLAGFFAHLGFEKRGFVPFAKDRFRRVTLVFVLFWPVTIAAIVAVALFARQQGLDVPEAEPVGVPLTHLWFLYVLTLFYIALLGSLALGRFVGTARIRAWTHGKLLPVLASRIGPLLLAIPMAGALFVSPLFVPWSGIPTPEFSFVPNTAAAVSYGAAFVFGWLIFGNAGLWQQWAQQWRGHLAVAILATVVCVAIIGPAPADAGVTMPMLGAFVVIYAIGAWSWVFALFGVAQRFLSSHSPVLRYLAEASYWLYISHLPVVMLLQVLLVQASLPAFVKFVLVVTVSVASLLIVYHVMVRRTWIGWLINGRRHTSANG